MKYEFENVSIRMVKEPPVLCDEPVNSPERAVEVMYDLLHDLDREMLVVVNLRTNCKPINMNVASIGTINASVSAPREVLKSAEISPDSDLYDSVFTNGAHYFHENITFYLRRQDPDMKYGIGAEPIDIADTFIIDNRSKDVSVSEYVEEGVRSQC